MTKAAKIVCCGNMKGGVGKTTSTMLMATELHYYHFKKVIVLDCDEQATITRSREGDILQNPKMQAPYEIRQARLERIIPTIKELKASGEYDIIFIDIPRITEDLNNTDISFDIISVLAVLDVLFIPFTSQTMDLQATQDFMNYVKEVAQWKQQNNYQFKFIGFQNKWKIAMENKDIPEWAEAIGLPLMKNSLKDNTLISRNYSTYISLQTKKSGKELLSNFISEVNSIIS